MAVVILEGCNSVDVTAVSELLQQRGYIKLCWLDDHDMNDFRHYSMDAYNLGKCMGMASALASLKGDYVVEYMHLTAALNAVHYGSIFALGFVYIDKLLANAGVKLIRIIKDASVYDAAVKLAGSKQRQLDLLYTCSAMPKMTYWIDVEPVSVLLKWLQGETNHGQKQITPSVS